MGLPDHMRFTIGETSYSLSFCMEAVVPEEIELPMLRIEATKSKPRKAS